MIYEFDRYINGMKMAEGVSIHRANTMEEAMSGAARLASKGPKGEAPVLVLRNFVKMDDIPDAAEAATEIERLRRIIYNLLDDGDEADRAEARAALGEDKPFEDRWDNA